MTYQAKNERSERSAWIVALYRDGGTIRGMGRRLHVPHRVIRNALRGEGIAVRRRSR